ncbi:MAG TPA: hypothetical protein VKG45_04485 [Actinomycetes bacterium]|nr:hypothetical protein [Actinomycetes bacterium]
MSAHGPAAPNWCASADVCATIATIITTLTSSDTAASRRITRASALAAGGAPRLR